MVTKSEYGSVEVEIARSVLVEFAHLLGEYRDHFVLVGGGAPPLLCPGAVEEHIGSLDVDILFDHGNISDAAYSRIRDILLKRGYYEKAGSAFSFYRDVAGPNGEMVEVKIDLLAGEYGGTGRSHRTQEVQDVRMRKTRGGDLLFESTYPRRFENVMVEAALPGGGHDRVLLNVCGVGPFIIMKGFALRDRLKEKDAYDIVYCLRNAPGGIAEVAGQIQPYLGNRLAHESLEVISEKFARLDSVGPISVADFMEVADPAERARIIRDAFERGASMLDLLKTGRVA